LLQDLIDYTMLILCNYNNSWQWHDRHIKVIEQWNDSHGSVVFSTRSKPEIKIQRTPSLRLACTRKISPRYRRRCYRGRYRRARVCLSPFSYWMRAYRKRGRVNSVSTDLCSSHTSYVFRKRSRYFGTILNKKKVDQRSKIHGRRALLDLYDSGYAWKIQFC